VVRIDRQMILAGTRKQQPGQCKAGKLIDLRQLGDFVRQKIFVYSALWCNRRSIIAKPRDESTFELAQQDSPVLES